MYCFVKFEYVLVDTCRHVHKYVYVCTMQTSYAYIYIHKCCMALRYDRKQIKLLQQLVQNQCKQTHFLGIFAQISCQP